MAVPADPARRITAEKFRTMLSREGELPAQEPEVFDEPGGLPDPFDQFQQNIGYARQLVRRGQSLEHLGVGAFDVTDPRACRSSPASSHLPSSQESRP